jgi:tetratricopeptide (TPR) repeat protein
MGSRRHGASRAAVVAFALAGVLAAGGSLRAEEDAWVRDARAAAAEPDAVERLRRQVDAIPEADREARAGAFADVQAILARALAREGAWEEAVANFEDALRVRERADDRVEYAEALLAIARQALEAPNPSNLSVAPYLVDAVASARKVDDPALAARRERVLAEALQWQGDDSAAVEHWRAGLRDLPADAARVGNARMAHALYRLGRFGEAAEAWRQAGDRLGEASAWAAARDGAKAMAVYAELLRERPGDAGVLDHALAAARFANARPALEELLAKLEATGPSGARVLRVRGVLREEAGDAAGAAALLTEATRADPAWAQPWVDLGRVRGTAATASDDDRRKGAIDAWLEALRRDPQDDRVKRLVWDQAGIDFAEGTRAGGDDAALRRSLAAQAALVELFPDDAEAAANLGNSLRVAGRPEESVAAYAKALAANPDSASIQSDMGLALSGAGRIPEAVEAFERAVALDPTFTSARQSAARYRWLAGDDDEGEAHLAAAVAAARSAG